MPLATKETLDKPVEIFALERIGLLRGVPVCPQEALRFRSFPWDAVDGTFREYPRQESNL